MATSIPKDGVHINLSDPSEAIDAVIEKAEKAGYHEKLKKHKVFALLHGGVGEKVPEGLMPKLSRADIILNCGNKHFANTERRHYNGSYQTARAGPSMCPGGDASGPKEMLPILQKVAAKEKEGKLVVDIIGKGGAGHSWGLMRKIGLDYEEIGDVLKEWNSAGELVSITSSAISHALMHGLQGTFPVSIGADLSHKREPGDKSTSDPQPHLLIISEVLDKVVHDITGEEGTGIWSNMEAIELHVPAFTLDVAHTICPASAYRGDCKRAHATFTGGFPPSELDDSKDKKAFIEDIRQATYAACLAIYIQGMNIWLIDYSQVWQIWRAGCIIQVDYISVNVLAPVLKNNLSSDDLNLNFSSVVAKDIKKYFPALRRCLEVSTGTHLPISFYEAELDYFSSCMFDKKGDQDA
ncbi:6-phosphogluconate dehydrogenase C-terminal domain-like protein [Didymella exigua CBS 183.55]|uniref:phosphogluconate dehydrogenase (NADP(+)-dependent, decarboxylating) n=1 Tax=Didymella exigua CBS 183.55 TaxID=1150837 RepID=A0A6A5RT95_9PLEO|nr:6-phosphogluconate dehydrogenase C-terminal domain-like protein [Didymella exigua CBS 183.55]KAF1930610.1 6-phosphogluconate dehydrogenase C-terminal domain-like protein [Didymella exigua CBS 183.55]